MLPLAEESGAGSIVVEEQEPGPFEALLGKDFSKRIRCRAFLYRTSGGADPGAGGEPEIKAALRARTERAAKLGIFGAPSFVVDGELFWGDDRLEDALFWAGPRVDEGVAGGDQSEER